MKKIFFLLLFSTVSLFGQTKSDIDRIQILVQDKKYAESLGLLDQYLTQNSANNIIHQIYADVLLAMGQPQEALASINKAITLAHNNPTNYLIAGNIHRTLNDYTNAQNAYNTAIRINPSFVGAYLEYAMFQIKNYKPADAKRLLKLAQNFDPDFWMIRLVEAKIEISQKKYNNAQTILFKAVNDFPYEEELLIELSQIYIMLNKPRQALALIQEANTRFGDSPERNLLIGKLMFINKDYTQAIEYFDKTKKTFPAYTTPEKIELSWNLYNLYMMTGDKAKALSNLTEVLRMDPKNQLYQSAYFNYLMNNEPVNTETRVSYGNYLYKESLQERKKGLSLLYVNMLQKAGMLDPKNVPIKDKLLEYVRLTKNEHEINALLHEIAEIDTTNTTIQSRIKIRNYQVKHNILDQSKPRVYQYVNKVYIQPSSDLFSELTASELTNSEKFFGNIQSVTEYKKPFSQESRTIFQGNTDFNMITHITFDNFSNMNALIYDKQGLLLTNMVFSISDKLFSQNIISYISSVSKMLPAIGYVTKRMPDSSLEITLGNRQNITKDQKITVFNQKNTILGQGTVTTIANQSASIKLDQIHSSDMIGAYVIPSDFFGGSINTNKTFDTRRIFQDKKNHLNF